MAFDPVSLSLAGPAAPVLPGVETNLSSGAFFSVSRGGLLAYVPGGLTELDKTAVWVDRDGRETEIGVIRGLGFQYGLYVDSNAGMRSWLISGWRPWQARLAESIAFEYA